MKNIIWFKDLSIDDVEKVGGKNAALGEMVKNLKPLGVKVPDGFATTSEAYNHFLDSTGLRDKINQILNQLDIHDIRDLQDKGAKIRQMILSSELPQDLKDSIKESYQRLEEEYDKNTDVAVRSSATAEDLPGASFAGQQETFLNIRGAEEVIEAAKKCIASLFTNRAISYRHDKGFSHENIALSVGVQKMVRSDLASSGVMFSIDTETGFDKVVMINGSYGLGDMIVQGRVVPDEFLVFKPVLEKGYHGVISKQLGEKDKKMIYADKGSETVEVDKKDRVKYCLTDEEINTLGKWAVKIEQHFSAKHDRYQPMDIEWAKDGETNELFIVQARPETVHSTKDAKSYKEYKLKEKGEILAEGIAVGTKIAHGKVKIIQNPEEIHKFKKGEVLVTEITDPDWEPIMKIASAIVTNKGGRTSHAAIVSRELGIPCIVGSKDATERLEDGEEVTIDSSSGKSGYVYKGKLDFEEIKHQLDNIPETKTKVMVNIGSPHEAFKNHYLPVKGVGLGRLEFIITSHVQAHPNALINFGELKNSKNEEKQEVAAKIEKITKGYQDKTKFYLDELAEGVAKISAAFWPYEVIIRFSDFKTNEYSTLVGGKFYEPEEANPMLGWRGASRYYHEDFKKAFSLEVQAIKKVRQEMGLTNTAVMIPFCRTIDEAKKVLDILKENDLSKDQDKSLNIYVMCEIPSNILLADKFLDLFDGMSIGSNDLTQLTLGLDRDSEILHGISNEKDQAVKKMISKVIKACVKRKKYVGICGQAPSDFPDFTKFLISKGIESISLNPDTVIKTLPIVAEKESEIK